MIGPGTLLRRFRLMLAILVWATTALAPGQGAVPAPNGLRLERAVVLMRHGVRPPTKSPPLPPGSARDPWPAWPVPPGNLTPHGADGIRRLAEWDRARWISAGLLPRRGCPSAGALTIASDSDQRTIATGDTYAAALAPGCPVSNLHRPEGQADPLFATAGEGSDPFDPARADAAVAAALGPGGIAAAEARYRDALGRLDRILCGAATAVCGVAREPSTVVPAAPGRRPKLAGALDRGSTGAQVLLLEYAEGKPPGEVGWGRATRADIAALSALHAAEFAILARPPYLAARNVAPVARALLDGLTGAEPRLTAISGHDTNVAALGGLLDLHWHVPGYAADDPAPGGALVFERLRDRAGRAFVRASYRAQTLEQLRRLTPLAGRAQPYFTALALPGCPKLCPAERFVALVRARLDAR